MRSTSDDSIDGTVLSSASDVLVLSFPIIICKEVLVNDSVDIGVLQGSDRGSGEARFVSLGVNGEGAKELLGLVEQFFDGKGSFNPVDRGVDFFQPRES